MQLFYSEIVESLNQNFDIDQQESAHISKVLRKNIGDKIFVTNGKGKLFETEITSLSKKKCSLKVLKNIDTKYQVSNLSIAIAPTKNIARTEWFLEKSIEIGIHSISLVLTQNSERKVIKIDRLKLKALSAMKQSLNVFLPELKELEKFEKFIKTKTGHFESKLIAYCKEDSKKMVREIEADKKTIVLIGPEGGFTSKEVDLAEQYGFKTVSLGSNRLRTETAGLYVVSVFNSLLNQ